MSTETILLVFIALFALALVWLSVQAVSLRDDLDLERMKHSETRRYLERKIDELSKGAKK